MPKLKDWSKECGIYAIINTQTGRIYVGQAIRFHDRWRSHRNNLNNKTHPNYYLQADWDEYGADVFEFQVLERMTRFQYFERKNIAEREHLAKYLGNSYNIVVVQEA